MVVVLGSLAHCQVLGISCGCHLRRGDDYLQYLVLLQIVASVGDEADDSHASVDVSGQFGEGTLKLYRLLLEGESVDGYMI